MRQTLFCVVGDYLQRNQRVQQPRPRPLRQLCCLGRMTPCSTELAHSGWLKQPDTLSWMVRDADRRPGPVAAILLPEGPRLRMKQIQGGGRTRRDFLYGISNMLSSSTLTPAGVKPHRDREKLEELLFTMCLRHVAGALKCWTRVHPAQLPFEVAALPPKDRGSERLRVMTR